MQPESERAPALSAAAVPKGQRVVPMTFFDPHLIAAAPPPDLLVENWMLQALLDDDAALRSARTGAGRTLLVVAIAGTVFALGLALTLHSIRSHAKLAQLRADFVATVTHELKTPVATIRAAGDTLVAGRVSDGEGLARYAQLMVNESKHLTRLLDNLLAYARITDTTEVYSLRPDRGRQLVDACHCAMPSSRLEAAGFVVKVDIAPDLPPIEADWTAVCLVLDNVIDNAIRYSKDTRSLTIERARARTARSRIRGGGSRASAFPPTRSRTSRAGSSAAAAPAPAAAAWGWRSSSGSSGITADRCRFESAVGAGTHRDASISRPAPTRHEAAAS